MTCVVGRWRVVAWGGPQVCRQEGQGPVFPWPREPNPRTERATNRNEVCPMNHCFFLDTRSGARLSWAKFRVARLLGASLRRAGG
jgi:hypothetical protein